MNEDNQNKETPNSDILTFTVMNTVPFTLLPITVTALRATAGSQNPAAVIFPIWIASLLTSLFAALICLIVRKLKKI